MQVMKCTMTTKKKNVIGLDNLRKNMVMIYKIENEHEIWHLESQEFLYIRVIESCCKEISKIVMHT